MSVFIEGNVLLVNTVSETGFEKDSAGDEGDEVTNVPGLVSKS